MKKLIFIFLTVITFFANAQLIETIVPPGRYILRTLKNESWVETFPYEVKVTSLKTPTVVDTVYNVGIGITVDSINNITAPAGKTMAITIAPGWVGSGTIIPTGDNITFDRGAGRGANPELNGLTSIIGWTLHEGNIWKAYTTARFNQLYDDDVKQSITKNVDVSVNERNNITSVVNDSTFISTDLIGTDWIGSYCMGSFAAWSFESLKVIACNSSTGEITLERTPYYTMVDGHEFFMTNSLSNLTEAGKWCLNESIDTVYYWTADGNEPTNIEAATIENGFVIDAVDNVTIKNLKIRGFETGVLVNFENAYKSRGIIVDNCELTDCYTLGVNYSAWDENYLYPVISCSITNNIITGSSGAGIHGKMQQTTISGNTIHNIGLLENIGLDGYTTAVGGGIGMRAKIDTCQITNNSIYDVGYIGIAFSKAINGYLNNIENNIIKRGCLHIKDGSGIYTYGIITGTTITGNIVSDIGYSTFQECHGIYCDASTDGVSITNNVVYGCNNPTSFGIFLSNTTNATVSGNTLYNNTVQLVFKHWLDYIVITNNSIANNTLYSITPTQECAQYSMLHDFTTDTLELTANKYYSTQNAISIKYDNSYYSLMQFQAFSSQEAGAVEFDEYINNYENVQLESPNLAINSYFNAGIGGWATNIGSWDNTQLDTGSVQITIPASRQGYLNTNLDSIGDDVLKIEFDVIAPDKNLTADIYINGGLINHFIANNTRRHYELYKDVSQISVPFLSCFIHGNDGDSAYFDNITVHDVSVDFIDPTEKSKLFVNDTKSTKSFNLSGTYFDVVGDTTILSPLVLGKYTSLIGILQD